MIDRILGLTIVAVLTGCAASESHEQTGSTEQAIIAGDASGDDQNAVVLLHHAGPDDETCSATMLAPNLLVTARHCVADDTGPNGAVVDWRAEDLHVFVGTGAFATVRGDATKYDAVGRTIVSPASTRWYPDVAFVVLDRSLDVPTAAIRKNGGASVGETLDVVGYGLDETGERPKTRMQRHGATVSMIGPGRSPNIAEPIEKGEIVFGEAACSGDSGGPAFSEASGALVGVASRVGNGHAATDDAPAAFCVGATTDDIYTTLDPVADVLDRAFALAGATPVTENGTRPADLTSAKITPAPSKSAAADDPLLSNGGGCTAAPRGSNADVGLVAALVFSVTRRRRARNARAR